ncbi:MAG: hypothetical protein ACRDGV_03155 [Candidatus Limnocylindria bacterium]
MKASAGTPRWAVELTAAVCADAEIAPPSRLLWRRRRGEHSTGVTRRAEGIVAVRAGSDELDHRLTLLHELAHWLVPIRRRARGRRRPEHHGRAFYAIAFDLYLRYGLTAPEALDRESSRYPSSLRHAAALGIVGAAAALAHRRTTLRDRPRRKWRVLVPEHAIRLERDGRWAVCGVCRQRMVGLHLQRARRSRRPMRHVLMTGHGTMGEPGA